MSTTTLDRPTTTSPTVTDPGTDPNTAHPLSDQEADALLMQSASLERTAKVRAGQPVQAGSAPSPRAWSRGGNVD